MTDPFVAEIRIFPFNFAPKGWAWCDGQLMPLSQNTALYAILGTIYGGDGKSVFALPDLQDRVPMHHGRGPGLSPHTIGEVGGSETVTLLESEMPAHAHVMRANGFVGDNLAPGPGLALAGSAGGSAYVAAGSNPPLTNAAFEALPPAGGDLPHNNMQPYLTFHFCIALQGVFPRPA